MEQCFLVSAGEMKQYDRYTTDCLGIPALVLMERAALATVQAMREELGDLSGKRILAVCGGGSGALPRRFFQPPLGACYGAPCGRVPKLWMFCHSRGMIDWQILL